MGAKPKTKVTGHSSCHPQCAALCDAIFGALRRRLPNLTRNETPDWCCFAQQGEKRFAYIKHRKTAANLDIWFPGAPTELAEAYGLQLRERNSTSRGGFTQKFSTHFNLVDSGTVEGACDLLTHHLPTDGIRDRRVASLIFPDETQTSRLISEGTPYEKLVTAYKRSREARKRCIAAHYGSVCQVCELDFPALYGPEAANCIQVHHRKPLSEIGTDYLLDPIADLCPVCPNCHAVIHAGGSTRDVEEVKQMIATNGGRRTPRNPPSLR